MKGINYKRLLILCLCIPLAATILTCKDDPVIPGYTVTITPEGGDFIFSEEMTLSVPAGAVNSATDITLRKISREELEPIFSIRGLSADNLIYGVEALPDGFVFNIPVELIIHTDLPEGGIPFVHEVYLESDDYSPAETRIIYDPGLNQLSFTIDHFSEFAAEYQQELEDLFNDCQEEACRCGRNEVVQRDKDYICDNGDCQISEIDLSIRFLDCPGLPEETAFLREVSGSCMPELVLTAAQTTVPTGASTTIQAHVELGCEPTEGQSVDFSISGPASVSPTYTTTNADGLANTTFIAGDEEGIATVTARATVSYYKYTIYASGGGMEELDNGPLITEELNEQVMVEIKDEEIERWSGTIEWHEDREYSSDNYIENTYYLVNFFLEVTLRNDFAVFFTGGGIAIQDVTFTITDAICNYNEIPYWYLTIEDIDAPTELQLEAVGSYWFSDAGMDLVFETDFDHDNYPDCFYTYIPCCNDPYGPCLFSECGKNGIVISIDQDEIPFAEGTYSKSYVIPGDGNVNPTKTISYTLTLQRDS